MPTYALSITIEEPAGTAQRVEVTTTDINQLDEFYNAALHSKETQPVVRVANPALLHALIYAEPEGKARGLGRPVRFHRLSIEHWERIRRMVQLVMPELLDGIDGSEHT